ncbi:MAG: BtpA/SgcQ family protein [Candidatus Cloacimonadaceae bacterium]
MKLYEKIFTKPKPIIGMVHVQALPGSPKHNLSMSEIVSLAVKEAILYEDCGLDAIILENMHDIPYLNKTMGAEVVSAMTAVACAVRKAVKIPLGIQILAAANQQALAVALAADLQFLRAEGFVYSHIADEGYIESCAGALLRYRKQIGAEQIAIFTDIKKKHSAHSITADVTIGETASAAEFFLSDGLIVTGTATGKEILLDDLIESKKHTSLPVFTGSGITLDNIEKYWSLADGFIIGSYFKEDGLWSNQLSAQRITDLVKEKSRLYYIADV